MGQEASSRFVKNLSAAFAERGTARKKRITLTSKMQRLLLACAAGGWIVAEKNAYRSRIPLISEVSAEAGGLREASGLEYFRRQFIREEDIIVLTGWKLSM